MSFCILRIESIKFPLPKLTCIKYPLSIVKNITRSFLITNILLCQDSGDARSPDQCDEEIMVQQKRAMWCYFGHQPKGAETKIKKVSLGIGSMLELFSTEKNQSQIRNTCYVFMCAYIYHHKFAKKKKNRCDM